MSRLRAQGAALRRGEAAQVACAGEGEGMTTATAIEKAIVRHRGDKLGTHEAVDRIVMAHLWKQDKYLGHLYRSVLEITW